MIGCIIYIYSYILIDTMLFVCFQVIKSVLLCLFLPTIRVHFRPNSLDRMPKAHRLVDKLVGDDCMAKGW
jgi:hypothetical protein